MREALHYINGNTTTEPRVAVETGGLACRIACWLERPSNNVDSDASITKCCELTHRGNSIDYS